MSATSRFTLTCLLTVMSVTGGLAAQTYDVQWSHEPYSNLGAGRTILWNGATSPADDAHQDVPFTFSYYGTWYGSVRISSNGYLTFGGNSGIDPTNEDLPQPTGPNNVIAPWWDDLEIQDQGDTDEVSYEIQGVAPFHTLVVEWRSVSRFGDLPGDYNFLYFQVELRQLGGRIRFHYGISGAVGSPMDFTATLGLENASGTAAVTPHTGNPTLSRGLFPAAGTQITFVPSSGQGYTVQRSHGTYVSLGAGRSTLYHGVTSPADDSGVAVPIGFDFQYYGQSFSQLFVTTNGYATFGAPIVSAVNHEIPYPGLPNPVLAPWWDDLDVKDLGVPDEVAYQQFGMVPGQRVLVIEWRSISRFGDTAASQNSLYFELVLYEQGNRIEFHYGTSGSAGAALPFSASLGLENDIGTLGLAPLAGNPDLTLQDFPEDGTIFIFDPVIDLVCGDCNDDGNASVLDALVAAQHGVGLTTVIGASFAACNVQGTAGGTGVPGAEINVLDALEIARFDAGLIGLLSCTP